MATGKTTIGKRLSAKLNLPFLDSDKEIELALGCSILHYFTTHGESKFRSVEERIVINKIHNNNNGFVMSLGGGSYLNKNIRELVNAVGISIWLNGNIDIIYNRISKSKNERPLTLIYNSKEKLDKLLKERVYYYNQATIKIDIIKTSKDNMTKYILDKINKYIILKNG